MLVSGYLKVITWSTLLSYMASLQRFASLTILCDKINRKSRITAMDASFLNYKSSKVCINAACREQSVGLRCAWRKSAVTY